MHDVIKMTCDLFSEVHIHNQIHGEKKGQKIKVNIDLVRDSSESKYWNWCDVKRWWMWCKPNTQTRWFCCFRCLLFRKINSMYVPCIRKCVLAFSPMCCTRWHLRDGIYVNLFCWNELSIVLLRNRTLGYIERWCILCRSQNLCLHLVHIKIQCLYSYHGKSFISRNASTSC